MKNKILRGIEYNPNQKPPRPIPIVEIAAVIFGLVLIVTVLKIWL